MARVDHRREVMCTSKRRYETRRAALWFGRALAQRAYHCPYCDGWHLTSSDRRNQR